MTSNIKKRPDYVRLFLAISSILVLLVLVFTAFNGLGINIGKLGGDIKPSNEGEGGGYEWLLYANVFSVSIFDLMRGVAANCAVVNGIRAAGFLLVVAIILAGVIVYGILSKKFSYKTLKVLSIANAVLLIAIGTLILCVRPLLANEVRQCYPGRIEVLEALEISTPAEFVYKYMTIRWGAIAAGSTAIIAAFGYIGTLIYAKKNKLEI